MKNKHAVKEIAPLFKKPDTEIQFSDEFVAVVIFHFNKCKYYFKSWELIEVFLNINFMILSCIFPAIICNFFGRED